MYMSLFFTGKPVLHGQPWGMAKPMYRLHCNHLIQVLLASRESIADEFDVDKDPLQDKIDCKALKHNFLSSKPHTNVYMYFNGFT